MISTLMPMAATMELKRKSASPISSYAFCRTAGSDSLCIYENVKINGSFEIDLIGRATRPKHLSLITSEITVHILECTPSVTCK